MLNKILFLMMAAWSCFGTAYYIDFTSGSDANNGTAKETPWKYCPGMNGAAGRTMMQPDSSVPGSAIVYASAIYRPNRVFRSAELVSTGTPGVLEVHLLYDPADQWYLMELSPGVEKGRIFDAIRETNTTVTEADVTLFPCA